MVEQEQEHRAVLQAGMACELLSEAEMVYWHRMLALVTVVVLDEHCLRDNIAAEKAELSGPPRGKARSRQYMHAGCDAPELKAQIRDMKRRTRIAASYFQKLRDDYTAAQPYLSQCD
jgi:hypothetical protein